MLIHVTVHHVSLLTRAVFQAELCMATTNMKAATLAAEDLFTELQVERERVQHAERELQLERERVLHAERQCKALVEERDMLRSTMEHAHHLYPHSRHM